MNKRHNVLLLISNPVQASYLKALLQNFGCQVYIAHRYNEGIRIAREIPLQVMIIDSFFHGMDWQKVVKGLKRFTSHVYLLSPEVKDISSRSNLVDGYIKLPIMYMDLKEKIFPLLENIPSSCDPPPSSTIDPDASYINNLILGESKRIKEVKNIIRRVAETDVTVLLRGESGTGKELAAQALYKCSRRRDKPFVKVLCAAIPEGLLESELFGHEKGAFTGAHRSKPGKFEFANGGTIFLDEIGDLPLLLQVKLLQVLQDGEFSKIGGKEVKVDVRVIAATNKNLEKSVVAGSFREDLFYRLNVVSITMPPLRDRKGDIPILTEHFLHKYCELYNRDYRPLSRELMDRFMAYDWPGNVRELENMVKRIIVLGSEEAILPHLQTASEVVSTNGAGPDGYVEDFKLKKCNLREIAKEAVRKAEEEAIRKALIATRWNKRKAAELLSISYKTLFYKMKEYNLLE